MSFQYVTIYYGPCDSFYTITHKPQKLRGLRDKLQKLGYRVDLVPVTYVNFCMLEICGHEVFRCNIQNLQFNMPYELDSVCQRAVKEVQSATTSLHRARNYLWFWNLIEDQIFCRGPHGPKDYFPKKSIEIAPFATCIECVNCCGILAQKKQ
ncbi:hypothetical protein ABMA28_015838 [Loxostege sticticalis]|uniref:Uncharacterized protein n=1 Tax=Loxostege sticticalis TaxID=481309 RepID=A0ABD0TBG9_LOXSC